MSWRLLPLIAPLVLASTTLYNGGQNIVLSPNMSTGCFEAFDTPLNCPGSVQLLTYSNRAVAWNTSALTALCTSGCKSSLADLMQAVTAGCGADYILLGNQNFTYPTIIDLFQYKWGLTCLKSVDSGDFCSDVETTWNITSMVANNAATWPQHTKKTFYDISSGDWDPYTDENGTLADPYNYDIWPQAANVGDYSDQKAAFDYYTERPAPSDDTNFGWSAPLSADEYPLEIQCSSCFQQRYIYGMESTWGDVWDVISSQVWDNVKANCNTTTEITPAHNLTLPDFVKTAPAVNASACPNPITVANMSCVEIGLHYSVPTASLMAFNTIGCRLVHGSICAGPSCPVAVNDKTQSALSFVGSYDNFTVIQFLSWNRYINPSEIMESDVVCVGPPGGPYSPPAATPAYPTQYTTTATPTEPTAMGTIPNCGLYYVAKVGDFCNTITLRFSITLSEFFGLDPSFL